MVVLLWVYTRRISFCIVCHGHYLTRSFVTGWHLCNKKRDRLNMAAVHHISANLNLKCHICHGHTVSQCMWGIWHGVCERLTRCLSRSDMVWRGLSCIDTELGKFSSKKSHRVRPCQRTHRPCHMRVRPCHPTGPSLWAIWLLDFNVDRSTALWTTWSLVGIHSLYIVFLQP